MVAKTKKQTTTSTAKKATTKTKAKATTKTAAKPATRPKRTTATTKTTKATAKSKAKTTTTTKAAKAKTTSTAKTTTTTKKSTATVTKTKRTSAKSTTAKTTTKTNVTATASNNTVFGKFAPYEPKRNEEYMNEKQLDHFRMILDAWKRELMEEVDQTLQLMKETAETHADPNDQASDEERFALEIRTRERERKLIKKIEKALQQIEEDDYGYCDACGVEIGIRRLEARPTAELCIDCKTLAEIREKRVSS